MIIFSKYCKIKFDFFTENDDIMVQFKPKGKINRTTGNEYRKIEY